MASFIEVLIVEQHPFLDRNSLWLLGFLEIVSQTCENSNVIYCHLGARLYCYVFSVIFSYQVISFWSISSHVIYCNSSSSLDSLVIVSDTLQCFRSLLQWLHFSPCPYFFRLGNKEWGKMNFTNFGILCLVNQFSKSFCLVSQSCLTLCDPMACSTPGFPVGHYLQELAQTHVHWVGDAIQPFHPLSSPSACSLSQHQGLFQWVSSSQQVAKVLELQHQCFQ